jgi:hypothetical protein
VVVPRAIGFLLNLDGLNAIVADGNFIRDLVHAAAPKIGSRNRFRRLFAFVNELRRIDRLSNRVMDCQSPTRFGFGATFGAICWC